MAAAPSSLRLGLRPLPLFLLSFLLFFYASFGFPLSSIRFGI